MLAMFLLSAALSVPIVANAAQAQIPVSVPSSKPSAIVIDAARKKAVIARLVKEMQSTYLFPDKVQALATDLQARLARGDYDKVQDGFEFAGLLSEQVKGFLKEKHFGIDFIPEGVRKPRTTPYTDEELAASQRNTAIHSQRLAHGIFGVQRLKGNIGYLNLEMFPPVEYAGNAISAAMTLLAGSDALIIDLRTNTGGHTSSSIYWMSHFFDQATHIEDSYNHADQSTTQIWTSAYLPSPRYNKNKAIYILTSNRTFSAAEHFAYHMQAFQRAKIIGETTGGGAHGGIGRALDDNFFSSIPIEQSINTITKSDWDNVGVKPDVMMDAKLALPTAQLEILKAQLKKTTNKEDRSEIVEAILATNLQIQQLKKSK